MKFNVKDPDEENYDFLFLSMDLMEIIGIKDILGDNLNVSDVVVNPCTISFSLDNRKKLIDVCVQYAYHGKVYRIILYYNNETVVYELNQSDKKIIRVINSCYENSILFKKIMVPLKNIKCYVYEFTDYKLRKDITIKFNSSSEIDDERLQNFLLGGIDSIDEIFAFLREFAGIKGFIIKILNSNQNKWYYLENNNLEVLDNYRIDDVVMNKVYKYN